MGRQIHEPVVAPGVSTFPAEKDPGKGVNIYLCLEVLVWPYAMVENHSRLLILALFGANSKEKQRIHVEILVQVTAVC